MINLVWLIMELGKYIKKIINILFSFKLLFYKNKKKIKVKLHLGVHKTASTYIQDTLEYNLKSNMKFKNIHYFSLDEFRKKRKYYGLRNSFNLNKRNEYAIYSDENLLGGNLGPLYGNIYKNNDMIIRNIINYINCEDIEIIFVLRPFSTYLPSSYCEMLRHHKFVTYEEYVSNLNNLFDLSWFDIFKNTIENNQNIKFSIYNFANFTNNKYKILKNISFDILEDFPADINVSRSSFTNSELNNLANKDLFPKNNKKFDPHCSSTHLRSSQNFLYDLNRFSEFKNVKVYF